MPKGRYNDPNRKGWHNQYGKTKRYEEVIEAVVANIEAGLSYEDAFSLAGIHRDQLYAWLKDPKKAEPLEQAKLRGKLAHLRRINEGVRTWQSSAWYLERRFRDEFALTKEKQSPQSVKVVFEGEDDEE